MLQRHKGIGGGGARREEHEEKLDDKITPSMRKFSSGGD